MIELGDPTGGGWEFVFLILFFGLGYSVGGAVVGARRKGEPLKKGPEMLKVHPHYGNWMQLHGLVQDGVNFSRARIDAKRGVKRGSYAAVSRPAPAGEEQGEMRSSGAGGKSKRSSKESKSKGAKAARGKKSAKSNKASKAATTDEAEAAEETVAEEQERLLQEERSAGVHSSQQAIKVVGLNG